MDSPNVMKSKHALQRRLSELEETQQWTHHVADIEKGDVRTTVLARPLAAASRAQRLSALGRRFDPSIFDGLLGPSYRLSPRKPYQASPPASLSASTANDYYAAYDYIVWTMPQQDDTAAVQRFMTFSFASPPQRTSVVSISIAGKAWAGKLGHVRVGLEAPAVSVRFPIADVYAAHVADLVFVPMPDRPAEIWMTLEAGIEILTFNSIALAAQPPVINPGFA
jgi:hypothetical protein